MSRVATRRALVSSPRRGITDWWTIDGQTCVAAYQPIGAASLAASYTNLANPGTYDAAPGVAPAFDTATGWTFNGTTQYLVTGAVPSVNGTWSLFGLYSDFDTAASSTWSGITGTWNGSDAAGNFAVILKSGLGGRAFRNGNQPLTVENYVTAGVIGLAGRVAYQDGSTVGTITAGDGSGTNTKDIWFCRINTTTEYAKVKIQAVAIYSTTLTPGDVATLTTRMAAL